MAVMGLDLQPDLVVSPLDIRLECCNCDFTEIFQGEFDDISDAMLRHMNKQPFCFYADVNIKFKLYDSEWDKNYA